MRSLLILLALLMPMQAASLPDFSGRWISHPDRLTVRQYVDRIPGGWHRHIEGVRSVKAYTIEIRQTADSITIVFPGGAGNFLTAPPFPLDGESRDQVTDRGDHWMKEMVRGSWDGGSLRLSARRMADRWDAANPAAVADQETALNSTHVLTLDETGTRLTIDTVVSDEKGLADYRQVFTRE
jgi:hypothetical protein